MDISLMLQTSTVTHKVENKVESSWLCKPQDEHRKTSESPVACLPGSWVGVLVGAELRGNSTCCSLCLTLTCVLTHLHRCIMGASQRQPVYGRAV